VRILILSIIVIFLGSNSVKGQCSILNNSFGSGEKAYYDVYYHWGFIWLNAASVSFETKPLIYNGKKAYHFISVGKTLPNYNWIYSVYDIYESKADSATLNPIWFSKNTSEGGTHTFNRQDFDAQSNNIYTQIKINNGPLKKDTLIKKECVFDLLTAIYASRNFDFKNKNINEVFPINLVILDKIYPLYLRYLGKEEIETQKGKKYKCEKFSILLVEGTIFSGGEDMTVWVSDDKVKVPIRIEAKILIGSIVANLNTHSGNIWPITAEIDNKQ